MRVLKPLKEQISFTTANTVYDSTLVRIHAPASSVVTIAEGITTIASFTIPAAGVEYVEKTKTATLAGSTTLNCTPVAYKN
jgi:hypothetical protein